ncbi:hypothetical protein ACFLZB_01875 [Nanoarchaeota archaeon]
MNKKIWLILLSIIICTLFAVSAQAQVTSQLINLSGTTRYVSYTGTVSAFGVHYADTSGNPDVGIEICGAGLNKYVSGGYGANVSGTMIFVPITYKSDPTYTTALASTGSPNGGTCYWTQASPLFISGSYLGSKTPTVYYAAFPGRPWTAYDTNQDLSAPSYVFMNTGSWLRGSYSVSGTYSQTTKNITFGTNPQVTFIDVSGNSFSRALTHVTLGVHSQRPIVVAVCNDTYGQVCHDGVIVNTTSQISSGIELYSGVPSPTESATDTRYMVVNGLGTSLCIGPNVNLDNVLVVPSVTPAGPIVNVSAQVENDGNVDITSSFNVSFYDQTNNVFLGNYLVTGGLTAGGSHKTAWVLYNTTGLSNGAKTVNATALDAAAGIADCNNGNDDDPGSFSIELVYLPYVWIDGIQNDTFPYPGRPYNVTIQINNSNGNPSANTTIMLTEQNGLSLLAPTQTYTVSGNQRGVKSLSTAELLTDDNGMVDLTLIPTGNKLYTSSYAYTNIDDHVGNYSLYFEIFNAAGTELQLFTNNQKVGEFNFTLTSQTAVQPNATERYSLSTHYQNTYVEVILNFIHQIRSTASLWFS